MTTNRRLKGQRGNALFLILIAVALFAALSYAVTRSGRGSGGIDREQALIAASQITQYPAGLRTSITRMVVTGIQANNLTFDTADTSDSGVFSTTGGGATNQDPPANIGGATDWRYKTAPGGAGAMTGWFISGIGTSGADGKDIFAFLNGLSPPVCTQILRGLGLNGTPRIEGTTVDLASATDEGEPTQSDGGLAASVGTAAADFVFFEWNDATNPGGASPQAFACVDNGGTNVYYHALFEQ